MLMIQSNYNMSRTNISNSFYDGLLHFTKCRLQTLNVDDENLNCTVKQTGRHCSHVEKVLGGIE